MPYDSIEEAKKAGFPTSTEEIDLTLAQINKLAEIYDAVKKAGTAKTPFAVAWAAWKEIYKIEGDKWVKIEKAESLKQLAVITNAELLSIESHDAILQTLERWIPGYDVGKGKEGYVYFSKEPFEKTIDDWNGTDLVFGTEHPNMKLFTSNPEEALKRVNARIIGKLSKAEIETAGHPRLIGTLKIDDEEVSELYDKGKLSLSTGFIAPINEEYRISGKTIPNHILLFEEDGITQPKDHGALILNMAEIKNEGKILSAKNETELKAIAEGVKKEFDRLWTFLKGITTAKENKKEVENQERNLNLEEEEMEKVEELTSKLETTKTELTNKTSKFETATKAHEDEVKGYKEKIAEFENKEAEKVKAERDAQFEQIVAKLPPGMTHKEEDKVALRAKFDNDPTKLMAELMSLEHKEGTGEEGNEFATDPDEIIAAAKELETEAAMEVPG